MYNNPAYFWTLFQVISNFTAISVTPLILDSFFH